MGAVAVVSIFSQAALAAPPGSIDLESGTQSADSGSPPPELRLRAIVARAVEDSVATWSRLDGPGEFSAAVERLAPNIALALKMSLNPADWSAGDLEAARPIEPKYAGDAWTRHRRRD